MHGNCNRGPSAQGTLDLAGSRRYASTPVNCVYRLLRLPVDDYLAALRAALPRAGVVPVLAIVVAAAASWWIYVPIHELCHAFGCLWTGGEVTRLEIDPLYGAALLHTIFPFVSVGSDYAGQLTGFDTHGNDLTYLATDFSPFLLTVLVGVPLLRAARSQRTPLRSAIILGVALPIAFAPFTSVSGDYYEMGSILVSRAVALQSASVPLTRWRSDDVFKLAHQLFGAAGDGSCGDAAAMLAAFLVGIVLIFVTYWLGTRWSRVIGCRRHGSP
jgi:hypothetical protein